MYGWLTRERGNGPRPRAAIPIKFLQLFVWWWAGDGVGICRTAAQEKKS